VGTANRKKKGPPERTATLGNPVIRLPGIVGNAYWEELAGEAENYLALLRKLERMPLGAEGREDWEDKMVSSLSHLAVHSAVLYRSVDEAIEGQGERDDMASAALGVESDEYEEAEEGYLDHLLKSQQAVESVNLLLQKLSAATERMGPELQRHAEHVSTANKAGSLQGARLAVNQAASAIDTYAAGLEKDLPDLRQDVVKISDNTTKFIAWLRENQPGTSEARESLRQTVAGLKEAIPETYRQTEGFLQAVEDLPTATKALASARNRLAKKLVAILDTFKELETFAGNALNDLAL